MTARFIRRLAGILTVVATAGMAAQSREAAAPPLAIIASDTAEWDTQKAYAKFQSMLAAHAGRRVAFELIADALQLAGRLV